MSLEGTAAEEDDFHPGAPTGESPQGIFLQFQLAKDKLGVYYDGNDLQSAFLGDGFTPVYHKSFFYGPLVVQLAPISIMATRLEKTHRRADGRPWSRRRWWLLVIIAAALLAYLLLGSQASLFHLSELEEEKKRLHERCAEARKTAAYYRDLLERLDTDDAFLEKLVRERLGLAAEGERVYVIIDKTTGSEREQ